MIISGLAVIAAAIGTAPGSAMAATAGVGQARAVGTMMERTVTEHAAGQTITGHTVISTRLLSERALQRTISAGAVRLVWATLRHATRADIFGPAFTQQPTLTVDDGASGLFGYSEAVQGSTLVVGASGVGAGGSVYVFTRTRGTWSEAELLTSTAPAGVNLGVTVAIQGSTIAADAPGYGEDGQGAVYVFTSHRGTWSQAAVLTAPDVAGGYLGSGLAISGDRIAAGAPGDGTDSQGSVYIYTGAGRDWSEPVELTASDGDNGWLGNTVQLSGNTLAASAQQAGGGQGAVYVYTDNLGTWSEPTELTASDGDGQLGSSLAFSGDLLAAGAPGAGTDSQGAVYIYRGRGLSWSDPVEVTVSDGDNGDLGGIVGLADQELVTAATGAGTLYLFALSRDGWQQRQSFSTPTGGGIGLTDGADQDTVAIGSPGVGENDEGAVYMFAAGF